MKPQRRILVVDDSAEDRGALRRFLLQDAEYHNLLEETVTGEAGVEACRRATFDAVLLDHHMPRMQGLEVLRTLRAMPEWKTPVIALTSTGHAGVAQVMLEEGAQDFLFKDDMTPSVLSRAITHAITKARLQRRVELSARRTSLLQQVTAALARALTPRQVVEAFLRQGLEALGSVAGFVAFLSPDGTQLDMDASPGFSSEDMRGWEHIPLSASLPITDAARTGALITLGSMEERKARYPGLTNSCYPALAAAPLRAGDNRMGALGVAYSEPRVFDEEDKDLLLVLSRLCAQSLERARLFEALQESEAQRRLALEAVRMGTWTWEPDTRRVLMDAVSRGLFGLPLMGTLDASLVSQHLPSEDSLKVRELFLRALEPQAPGECEVEVRVMEPMEPLRWALVKGRVVRASSGHAERLVGVCYDITERKRFEQGLVLQKESEKRRADFEQLLVGIVSHDLKNPLAAIRLQSELALRQGGLEERTQKVMTRISSAAERAGRMISDLLDFTQARLSGSIPVHPRELDAREVVAQVVEEVRQAFPHRQLSFECSGDTQGRWDEDRLAQVVTNLVQNAVKYSPEATSVQVQLRARGDEVELTVLNQGEPIAADSLPRIFEPLQRASSMADKAGRSVGLGLYIVKHVVEAHQGSIAVDSKQGEGTRFTVRLPRALP